LIPDAIGTLAATLARTPSPTIAKSLINRNGQNMQINMPKYAQKNAEKMAKYATKYAI
jgi:hypothetical protein